MKPATSEDYDAAVRAFWAGRDLQTQRQIDSGKIDAGSRGSVTGGLHLTALQDLIAAQFVPLLEQGAKVRKDGIIPLPGYYRRAKNWDIVVTWRGRLVAAIECKSQVGSFGNNFNNRSEEAIGNAVDLWRAHEAGLVGPLRHGSGSSWSSSTPQDRLRRYETKVDRSTNRTPHSTTPPTPPATNSSSGASSANDSTTPPA